jgi:hypothetical protein
MYSRRLAALVLGLVAAIPALYWGNAPTWITETACGSAATLALLFGYDVFMRRLELRCRQNRRDLERFLAKETAKHDQLLAAINDVLRRRGMGWRAESYGNLAFVIYTADGDAIGMDRFHEVNDILEDALKLAGPCLD